MYTVHGTQYSELHMYKVHTILNHPNVYGTHYSFLFIVESYSFLSLKQQLWSYLI